MRDLEKLTLEQVAGSAGVPGSVASQEVQLEFTRRQTQAQIEAAEATKETATYTRQNARYMLWSVIVLAVASVASFVLDLLAFLRPVN